MSRPERESIPPLITNCHQHVFRHFASDNALSRPFSTARGFAPWIVDRIFDSRGTDEHTIRLRDLVTVVSLSDLRHVLFCNHAGADDSIHDYDLAERLTLQLEFASVIVMTGGDGHPQSWRDEAEALIARLNPRALVVPIGSVPSLATTRRHGDTASTRSASAGRVLTIDPTSMLSWDPEPPPGDEEVLDLYTGNLALVGWPNGAPLPPRQPPRRGDRPRGRGDRR